MADQLITVLVARTATEQGVLVFDLGYALSECGLQFEGGTLVVPTAGSGKRGMGSLLRIFFHDNGNAGKNHPPAVAGRHLGRVLQGRHPSLSPDGVTAFSQFAAANLFPGDAPAATQLLHSMQLVVDGD
jgi:hypothetical protein